MHHFAVGLATRNFLHTVHRYKYSKSFLCVAIFKIRSVEYMSRYLSSKDVSIVFMCMCVININL